MNLRFSTVFPRAVGVSARSGFLHHQCRTATVSTNSIPSEQILTHGKYRGLSFNDCMAKHPEYCEWLKRRADKLANDDLQNEFVHYLLSQDQGGKHDDSSTPVLANTLFSPNESVKQVRVDSSNFAETLQVEQCSRSSGSIENHTSSDVPDGAKDERATPIDENTIMPYGKHQGEKFGDIIANYPKYCQWFLKQAVAKTATGEVHESSDFELYLKQDHVEKAVLRRVFPKNVQHSDSLDSGDWIVTFGAKWKDRTYREVWEADPRYCKWMAEQIASSEKVSKEVLSFIVYVQKQMLDHLRQDLKQAKP